MYEIFRSLEGISSLIETSAPPPSLILSKRYAKVKAGTMNWLVIKDLSKIYVLVTIRISTFPMN